MPPPGAGGGGLPPPVPPKPRTTLPATTWAPGVTEAPLDELCGGLPMNVVSFRRVGNSISMQINCVPSTTTTTTSTPVTTSAVTSAPVV